MKYEFASLIEAADAIEAVANDANALGYAIIGASGKAFTEPEDHPAAARLAPLGDPVGIGGQEAAAKRFVRVSFEVAFGQRSQPFFGGFEQRSPHGDVSLTLVELGTALAQSRQQSLLAVISRGGFERHHFAIGVPGLRQRVAMLVNRRLDRRTADGHCVADVVGELGAPVSRIR